MSSTVKKSVVAGVFVALLVAGGFLAWEHRDTLFKAAPESVQSDQTPITAAVERGQLPNEIRLNGNITYGDPVALPPRTGMITGLPDVGATVSVGEQIYESDGRPVTLMRGDRPYWRELSAQDTAGEDVRQLQQNLADMGLFEGEVDGQFGEWTHRAVKAWQKSLGFEETGIFDPTMVVVVDAPQIRIAQVTARLGETETSAASYTFPFREVHAALRDGQEGRFTPGQEAAVTLPGGDVIVGKVKQVIPGSPSGEPSGDDAKEGPVLVVELPEMDAVTSAPTSAVQISVASPDSAPEVLLVPAVALIATDVDEYALEVLRDGQIVRTKVEIGRAANGKVEVLDSEGSLLAEGDQVVISK